MDVHAESTQGYAQKSMATRLERPPLTDALNDALNEHEKALHVLAEKLGSALSDQDVPHSADRAEVGRSAIASQIGRLIELTQLVNGLTRRLEL